MAACPLCKGQGYLAFDVPYGHPDFGRIVPCHCKEAEIREQRYANLLRRSNLGGLSRLTFESLSSQGRSSDPAAQARYRYAFSTAQDFAENPEGWLVLLGVSGCGKTHMAAAIANRALERGHPVFFIVVPDLLDHLRSTFSPSSEVSYDELFEEVRNTPLLILDDLGTQSSTSWALEKLYQIINHRYNLQLPTVITTNLPLQELDERLRTRLSDPCLSRLLVLEEHAIPIPEIGAMGLKGLEDRGFENFDYRRHNLPLEERKNLARAFDLAKEFAQSPEGWLVFSGTSGCGKTHLAAAIANHRLRLGQPARFVVVLDLLDHLRSTFSPESRVRYDELFEGIKTAPLLILDELRSQSSPWAMEKLYQIINYRYNARLPTVFTTSNVEELDERLETRLMDPKLSVFFDIRAPSYNIDRDRSAPSDQRPRRHSR